MAISKGSMDVTTKESRKRQTTLGKLRLIMWKNVILRKRHWLLTFLELAIPVVLMCLAVYLRNIPDSDMTPEVISENSTFPIETERYLRGMFCQKSLGRWRPLRAECEYSDSYLPADIILFWGPPNNFTYELVKRVQKEINFDDSFLQNVTTKEEMNDFVDAAYFQANQSLSAFYVGIFFYLQNSYDGTIPKHLSYDLRLQGVWHTSLIYPLLQVPGPRNFTVFDFEAVYTEDGFVLLQSIIDRSYIAMVKGDQNVTTKMKYEAQMYPYPPYVQDHGLSQFYGSILPSFVVYSLVLLSPTIIKSIVHEKETGVRELIKMMGMGSLLNWIGWFLYSFMTLFFVVLTITIMLKVEIPSHGDPDQMLPGIIPYSNTFLLWLILMLYAIASIVFCFAVSCFFNKPSLATTVGVLAWIMSYFLPRALMDYQYDELGLGAKLGSCLLPNMAMTWAFRIISMFEGRGVGIQWDNLWESGNSSDELTIGWILIMLSFDILLYSFITWYVDQVLPGLYGVPKPWHFFIPKFGLMKAEKFDEFERSHSGFDQGGTNANFEDEPEGMEAGIKIKGLRKVFKTLKRKVKVAVDDVSFNCFKGQCTVLLGHNGAGKTTTMSILTGVYAPSGGYAEVNGYNIATHLSEARSEIGLCPQHNTLFTDLSVKEHLIYFGRLKGMSRKEAKKEANIFLDRLRLREKSSNFGSTLSGGMKRKLCLAIALIGGSRIIILDEPSSGLDPESRRWVWDIVQQERSTRTVLVTTHHMEEADVLGDRIAIMANGKVVCCGSSLFLKSRFGDGYNLTITTNENANQDTILKVIYYHLPGSSLRTIQGHDLIYKLPMETDKFASLLSDLHDRKSSLGILHLGLSLTTMEQVFLRIGELLDPEYRREHEHNLIQEGIVNTGEMNPSFVFGDETHYHIPEETEQDGPKFMKSDKLEGIGLILERLRSLFVKKIIYTKRKWVLLLSQGLLPVLVTLLVLGVDSSFNERDYSEPSLEMSLDMFEFTYSFVQSDVGYDTLVKSYASLFQSPYEVAYSQNISDSFFNAAAKELTEYRENHVTSLYLHEKLEKLHTRMLYQTIPFHTPGVGTNLLNNALLRSATGSEEYKITTYNSPLPPSKEWQLEDNTTTYSATLYSMMMPLALAFLTSSFLVFPLGERTSNAKQIQLMTGTSSWALWSTAFLWDMLTYSASALLIFLCCVLFDSKEHFTVEGATGALALTLLLYGIGSVPMAYVFSFPFSSAASGFSILALINILAGMIISTVTLVLRVVGGDNLIQAANIIGNITSLIPAYPASKAFQNIIDMGYYNQQCDVIEDYLEDALCKSLAEYNISSLYTPCCPQCAQLGNCFEPLSYYQIEFPGIGLHLIYLSVDFVFYFFILFLIEHGTLELLEKLFWKCVNRFNKEKELNLSYEILDNDVEEESNAAKRLMKESNPDVAIVVEELTKVFLKADLVAVKGISFFVRRGECFGLLGVNGAGKTTTFKMLTGLEVPSKGEAKIGTKYLSGSLRQFLKEIGYCPQFDAIIGELTGEEMLNLMAGLRGMPRKQKKPLIRKLIKIVDLTECYKRPCSTYSGGNKRKLSTAMALVGRPTLVFLDEPTSGVDPTSRRKVWNAVRDATSHGQSVILTSHSMDECEALCSKVVIMAKGSLMCSGTPQHLKFKFGQGYSLQIKLKATIQRTFTSTPGEELEDKYDYLVNALKQTIHQRLPGSKLTDQHRGMLEYRVPSSASWPLIFNTMESLKRGKMGAGLSIHESQNFSFLIEDYAVMDPSLEQVFLSFARDSQNEGKKTGIASTKV